MVDVAWVVNLMQEARELAAIKPRPAAIQAGKEFELAACEYRHGERRIRNQETWEQLRAAVTSSAFRGSDFTVDLVD